MADEPGGQEPTTTEPTQPSTSPAAPQGQEPQTFDQTYVEKLRNEAAGYRVELKETKSTIKDLQGQLKQLQDAQAASEQAALAEQGNFKELAEKTAKELAKAQADLAALQAVQDKVTSYEETLNELLADQRQGLPAPIIELLDRMPAVEQLPWLKKYRDELSQQQAQQPEQPLTAPQQAARLAAFNPSGGGGNPMTDAERVLKLRRDSGQQVVGPFASQQ